MILYSKNKDIAKIEKKQGRGNFREFH